MQPARVSSRPSNAPPRWATPRNPDRVTVAPRALKVARALGIALLPWQIAALEVAGEVDPATGRFAYPEVVLIVPRRAGKTTVTLVDLLRVAFAGRRRRGWYTAHRREVGAALWRDEWFPTVEASRLAPLIASRRSNGSESMTVGALGSTVRLFAPSGEALRSQNANTVVIDEAREFTADQGAALEAAVAPAQAVPRRRQRWVVSNAGGPHSTWLASKRDAALEAFEEGRPTRTCFLEWSADPDLDPDDPSLWHLAHPALGRHLDLEALLEDRELVGPERFRVEYLGLWTPTGTGTAWATAWDGCGAPEVKADDPVTFAVELDPDRLWCSIVAAGAAPGGRIALELVDRAPHGDWLLPRLRALVERHEPLGVAFDGGGPLASDAPSLRQLTTTVYEARTREVIAASGWLADAVEAGRVVHRHQGELTASVVAAERRAVGGAWLWRRSSAAVLDAGPVLAGSLAAWYQAHASSGVGVF